MRRASAERRQEAVRLYAQGLPVVHVARAMKTNKTIVRKYLRMEGVVLRPRGLSVSGQYNSAWKGGRTKTGGYWYVYAPNHPHATMKGAVLEHRLVMEKALGRYLRPEEVVHHKDKNSENNDLSNLQLFATNGEHLAFELTGRALNISEDGRRRISEAHRGKTLSAETREKLRESALRAGPRARNHLGQFLPLRKDDVPVSP